MTLATNASLIGVLFPPGYSAWLLLPLALDRPRCPPGFGRSLWKQQGVWERRLGKGGAVCQPHDMKLTAVFEPAKEGGYTCFVEELPAAVSQGETLEEAKANLLDALKLVLECQRELAERNLSPNALREPLEFAEG